MTTAILIGVMIILSIVCFRAGWSIGWKDGLKSASKIDRLVETEKVLKQLREIQKKD